MKSASQQFQLRNVKGGRCAATKIDRGWTKAARPAVAPYQLPHERLTKSRGLRAIEQIFVKGAIRTDARTEGDVHVDMLNGAKLFVLEL